MTTNNLSSALAVAITTTSQTTVQVATGDGAKFVNGGYAILYNAGVIELVKITGIAGDVLTVTRGQGGTTAATWAVTTTTVSQGPTGQRLSDMMLTPVTTFMAGATMVGDVNMALDPTADLHPVRKSWIDANYYPNTQTYQTALGYTPIQRAWNANVLGFGWNGNVYAYVDSTAMGNIWHSNNFNPGAKATRYANCPWASSIWEVGRTHISMNGESASIDASSPWCLEGLRTEGSGEFQPYIRAVWLRNQ